MSSPSRAYRTASPRPSTTVEDVSTRLGSIGLIVPDALVTATRKALQDKGIAFSVLGDEDDVDAHLDVVPASLAKGLEFDHVVLVEPAGIVAGEADERHRPPPALRLPDPCASPRWQSCTVRTCRWS